MRKISSVLALIACFIATIAAAAPEVGLASVYAAKFQGSRTASGEVFNHNAYTASHRTLPFNTLVRITRTDNGKSVVVRINDRGPFVNDYVTDISKSAAAKLGINNDNDEVRVKLEVVTDRNVSIGSTTTGVPSKPVDTPARQEHLPIITVPIEYATSRSIENPSTIPREYRQIPSKTESKTESAASTAQKKNPVQNVKPENPMSKGLDAYGLYSVKTTPSVKTGFAVQVASMSSHEAMTRKVAELKEDMYKNILVQMVEGKDGNPDYKVLLGPFDNRTAADGYLRTILQKKMQGFVVDLRSFK